MAAEAVQNLRHVDLTDVEEAVGVRSFERTVTNAPEAATPIIERLDRLGATIAPSAVSPRVRW